MRRKEDETKKEEQIFVSSLTIKLVQPALHAQRRDEIQICDREGVEHLLIVQREFDVAIELNVDADL